MSRALDPKTKAAIQRGDHTAAFREISEALALCHESLFDIEVVALEILSFLPDPKCYFFRDGQTLIFPKLRVVQSFIEARKLLLKHRNDAASVSEEAILAATRVILLMDAEHLTAANTRKRHIVESNYSLSIIHRELSFVDSLLRSDLHRHNKSPTLWNHRHWLLSQCLNRYDGSHNMISSREYDHIPTEDLLKRHFQSVIFLSGERHPKNYYAWAHARQLLLMSTSSGHSALLPIVKSWCLAHRSDISGWTFLACLPVPLEERRAVLEETIKYAGMFRYDNESTWWYFRAAASSSEELEALRSLRERMLPDAEGLEKIHLERAITWLHPSDVERH